MDRYFSAKAERPQTKVDKYMEEYEAASAPRHAAEDAAAAAHRKEAWFRPPPRRWSGEVLVVVAGLVLVLGAGYVAHEATHIAKITHSVDVAVGTDWPALKPDEAEKFTTLTATLPKRSISVLYANELGAAYAESIGAALRKGGWTSVIVTQGVGLGAGLSTGRGKGLARALAAALSEVTGQHVSSFGPEEEDNEAWAFIGVGVKR